MRLVDDDHVTHGRFWPDTLTRTHGAVNYPTPRYGQELTPRATNQSEEPFWGTAPACPKLAGGSVQSWAARPCTSGFSLRPEAPSEAALFLLLCFRFLFGDWPSLCSSTSCVWKLFAFRPRPGHAKFNGGPSNRWPFSDENPLITRHLGLIQSNHFSFNFKCHQRASGVLVLVGCSCRYLDPPEQKYADVDPDDSGAATWRK